MTGGEFIVVECRNITAIAWMSLELQTTVKVLHRHSGEGRNPGFWSADWVPAFAGRTVSGRIGSFCRTCQECLVHSCICHTQHKKPLKLLEAKDHPVSRNGKHAATYVPRHLPGAETGTSALATATLRHATVFKWTAVTYSPDSEFLVPRGCSSVLKPLAPVNGSRSGKVLHSRIFSIIRRFVSSG